MAPSQHADNASSKGGALGSTTLQKTIRYGFSPA